MIKKVAFATVAVWFMAACSTVPVSGRRQLTLIPGGQMLSLSYTNYQSFLGESKLSTNKAQTNMVKNSGRRIQAAVEEYMKINGIASKIDGFQWEFNLVDDPAVNAWCMPGGKVVFYTGIMPICQDETGVAVVMGHEVAHAVADHGNERMTQGLMAQAGQTALSVYMANKPDETRNMMLAAFGVGAQVGVLLPFSRLHESEADKLGLIFMAMAGYDPHEAPRFWERMSAKSGGNKPPEFMSTHPSDQRRIANLQAMMPEAMKYYKKN